MDGFNLIPIPMVQPCCDADDEEEGDGDGGEDYDDLRMTQCAGK